jgi:glycerophosphoryl diester phosphodiesterase
MARISRVPNRSRAYFQPALPRIFAHRGLALDVPENSLAAFNAALEAGADYLETDVQSSRDGEAIICHDADLSRWAGRSERVDQLTAAELTAIDLGGGERIVTLATALARFPSARFNIDVKDKAAVPATIAAIRTAFAEERVLITSFSHHNRRRVVKALKVPATSASVGQVALIVFGARLGILRLMPWLTRGVDAIQVPVRYGAITVITPHTVSAIKRTGLEVHVWTVNSVAEMKDLIAIGVDGIVTDRADLARELKTTH